MATLSTTAWVLHELGLAAGFGGNLFGLVAVNPALAEIQSKRERGKVTHVAWNRSQKVNGASLALMATTWFVGRALRGRTAGKRPHALTLTKDVLVGGALLGGASAMLFSHLLDREITRNNEPLQIDSPPTAVTKRRVADLQKITNSVGRFNVLMNAAVLAVTALLSAATIQTDRRA